MHFTSDKYDRRIKQTEIYSAVKSKITSNIKTVASTAVTSSSVPSILLARGLSMWQQYIYIYRYTRRYKTQALLDFQSRGVGSSIYLSFIHVCVCEASGETPDEFPFSYIDGAISSSDASRALALWDFNGRERERTCAYLKPGIKSVLFVFLEYSCVYWIYGSRISNKMIERYYIT